MSETADRTALWLLTRLDKPVAHSINLGCGPVLIDSYQAEQVGLSFMARQDREALIERGWVTVQDSGKALRGCSVNVLAVTGLGQRMLKR